MCRALKEADRLSRTQGTRAVLLPQPMALCAQHPLSRPTHLWQGRCGKAALPEVLCCSHRQSCGHFPLTRFWQNLSPVAGTL